MQWRREKCVDCASVATTKKSVGVDIWIEIMIRMNRNRMRFLFYFLFFKKISVSKKRRHLWWASVVFGVTLEYKYCKKIIFFCLTGWNHPWLMKFVVWLFRDGVSDIRWCVGTLVAQVGYTHLPRLCRWQLKSGNVKHSGWRIHCAHFA